MVARGYTYSWKRLRVFASSALLLFLPSCSGIFEVRPAGTIEQGVVFTFYKADASQPSRFRISNIVVQQHTRNGWQLIWALDGAHSLHAITYGATYSGLKETGRAPKLVRGQLYRVAATSDGLYGGADFLIDHKGTVVIKPPTI
jgi:hypothetical protein